jgi:hypothetical protein
MLIIENLDTLLQGISKIKKDIEYIKELSSQQYLSDEEMGLLSNNINYFLKNIKGIEILSNSYNSFDSGEQQRILDLTLDLYNDVNNIIQALKSI